MGINFWYILIFRGYGFEKNLEKGDKVVIEVGGKWEEGWNEESILRRRVKCSWLVKWKEGVLIVGFGRWELLVFGEGGVCGVLVWCLIEKGEEEKSFESKWIFI